MILLDAYAARSCPVKTQNKFDPTIPDHPDDTALQEVFAGAQAFKDEVLPRLATAPGAVDLRQRPRDQRARLTQEALAAGAALIIGPRLDADAGNHRMGSPDALIRGQDRADRRPGYHPLQVKNRKLVEPRRPEEPFCWTAALEHPFTTERQELPEHSIRTTREPDLLQMAHYVRLLQGLGLAADTEIAALVGTDTPEIYDHDHRIVWVDLRHRLFRTFSRTAESGWRMRSPMERYDHEFGFRLTVAQGAAAHVPGRPYHPRVAPIVVRECESCPWWQTCEPALDADDLSLRISKSPLDVREISVLRKLGISTLDDLAEADVEALLPHYLPETAHRRNSESRLRLAAQRSRMLRDNVALSRLGTEPIDLPEGDIEVDIDIETSGDGRVYLWGLLVNDLASPEPPTYHAYVAWSQVSPAEQIKLARDAMGLLQSLHASGRRVRIYHYSDYEVVNLQRLANQRRSPVPGDVLDAELARVRQTWVDLYAIMQSHFFGVHGLGLKFVATHGADFRWRDDEPGGLNSQTWFRDACDPTLSPDQRRAARQRVLAYNEDDVRATHALRHWLRTHHGATDPKRDGS